MGAVLAAAAGCGTTLGFALRGALLVAKVKLDLDLRADFGGDAAALDGDGGRGSEGRVAP
jgi:hypothetical protein